MADKPEGQSRAEVRASLERTIQVSPWHKRRADIIGMDRLIDGEEVWEAFYALREVNLSRYRGNESLKQRVRRVRNALLELARAMDADHEKRMSTPGAGDL